MSSIQQLSRPVMFTGQVGVDKGPFINKVAQSLRELSGTDVRVYNTGSMMYEEDLSIPRGEILKLPRGHLRALRRSVMRRIIAERDPKLWTLISSHASFRWAHGLFPAQDPDILATLSPSLMINVVDNVHLVHERLRRDHVLPHTMDDVMVAREAELCFSDLMATWLPAPALPFIAARGPHDRRAESVARLIIDPTQTKVYPSFPMTHVMDMPEVLQRIDAFRDRLAESFIVFDPADVDEKGIVFMAKAAQEKGQETFSVMVDESEVNLSVAEVLALDLQIDRQICDRDFRLIEQSNMIVSLVPDLPDGKPSLSSGVERELHHAFVSGKRVYVVWLPKRAPSPFISNHAHGVFSNEDELFAHFKTKGLLPIAA